MRPQSKQGQFSPRASQSGLKVKVVVLVKYLYLDIRKGGKRHCNMSEHVSLLGLKVTRSIFTMSRQSWVKSKTIGFAHIKAIGRLSV
jgi:hypothetical protein